MKKTLKILGGIIGVIFILGIIGAIVEGNSKEEEPKTEQVATKEEKSKENDKKKQKEQKQNIDDTKKAQGEYIVKMTIIMTNSSKPMQKLSELFSQPSQNPTLLMNSQWREDIIQQYLEIDKYRQEVVALDVPENFRETHDLTVKGFDNILNSKDIIIQGIDSMDAQKIIEGTKMMSEGANYFQQVNTKLNEMTEEILKELEE